MLNRIGIPTFALLHVACVAAGCSIDDRSVSVVSLQGELSGADAGARELGEREAEGAEVEGAEPEDSEVEGSEAQQSEPEESEPGGPTPGLTGNGGTSAELGGSGGVSGLGGAGQATGGSQLEPSPPADDPPPRRPPPRPVFDGRAGAELCPAGPYQAPLSGVPQVGQLFALSDNRHIDGPVWLDGALYFSAVGGVRGPSRIDRFVPGGTLETLIAETGSNGLAVDMQGNLLAASHVPAGIYRFALPSGARSQVSGTGTSPNDLVQRSDGNIYVTDLSRDYLSAPFSSTRVLRITPDGQVIAFDPNLPEPHGITLSPEGNHLYVITRTLFLRYPLASDGTPLGAIPILPNDALQSPEGLAMDCAGNVYTTETTRRLVRIFDPFGNELGRFGGPEVFEGELSNLAFGGPDRTTLFITTFAGLTGGAMYAAELNVPGLPY